MIAFWISVSVFSDFYNIFVDAFKREFEAERFRGQGGFDLIFNWLNTQLFQYFQYFGLLIVLDSVLHHFPSAFMYIHWIKCLSVYTL